MFDSLYIPNARQIEDHFSTNRDFPNCPQGADFKFVLCTSPRSGSTLIASMLYATRIAGDPIEYLNNQWIKVHQQLNAPASQDFDILHYLREWETRRTSPNGVFGIKLHYHQMRRAWRGRKESAAQYLKGYDKHLLLIRRDKVAQAVSLYRAINTQIWSSEDTAYLDAGATVRNQPVEFNVTRIAELLAFLIKEEEGWRDYLKTNNLPFVEFFYEDFLADYSGASLALLKQLGFNLKAEDLPSPQLEKQSSHGDLLIEQFRQALGLPKAIQE